MAQKTLTTYSVVSGNRPSFPKPKKLLQIMPVLSMSLQSIFHKTLGAILNSPFLQAFGAGAKNSLKEYHQIC